MRIAIIGSGAIGGLFGARLSGSGADVMLFDISKPLVEAISQEGITIETPSGEKDTFQVNITDNITTPRNKAKSLRFIVVLQTYFTVQGVRHSTPFC